VTRAVLVLAVLAAACAHAPRGEESAPSRDGSKTGTHGADERPFDRGEERRAQRGRAEVGIASFYAHRFHGRRTASGARYDMHALTCAHRSAPFGTRLRVTDVETGRAVVVTVNDRGPFAEGRLVDLSLAAARKLGIVERGVAQVRVEHVVE